MGLTIGGFGGHGIFLDGTKDSLVSENILGFDQFGDGTGVGGNSGDGLTAQSAVNLSITGNVIGFNQRNGIHILDSHPSGVPDPQAPNVKIRGNAIGHHEGVSMTNDHNGILIENSSSVLIGGKRDSATGGFQIFQDLNLISHNGRLDLNGTINGGHGVLISGSKSTSIDVQGNFIGTDHTGLSAKGTGNFSSGVAVINGANDVRIGGVSSSTAEGHPGAGLGNVISGNQGFGIEVTGEETTNVRIQGNLIGLLADGTFSSSGNQKSGVLINQANFVLIGTSSVSTTPDFRSRDSLSVSPTGNVITGNGGHGVLISNDANENFILENVIGLPLESTGKGPRISLTAVGNQGDGIRIDSGAFDNQVGDVLENNGKSFARGNLIFANGGAGIRVDGGSNTEILGNKIGGLLPGQTFNMGLGNKLNGIVIENSFGNRVGISASSLNLPDVVTERLLSNQIVANGFGGSFIDERHGVLLRGTSEDDIAGNSIGDPRHGIPNAGDGLHLNGVDRATIFDNDVTFNQGLGIAMISTNLDTGNNLNVLRGNRVFANDQRQILLLGADTRFNVLAGNQIGPIDALQEFGERFVGLELDGAQLNTIGGRNAGDANLFVGTQHGILIHNNTVSAATAVRNGILGNNFLVTDLPIDLRAPGDAIGTVTNNDLFGDNDDGPNGLQNHPVITSVQISEGPGQGGERTVLVQGFLESVGEEFYLIEFYTVVGETRFKIGEKIVGTNSSGVTDEIPGSDAEFIASFQTTGSIAPGVQLAATASRFGRTIDPNNFSALTLETSEFSAPSPGAVTASDQDLDGVLDAVESADANNDGIPDDLQRNVAVIPGQAINFDSFVQNQVVNLADVAVPFVAIVEAREQGFFRNAAVLGNLNRFNEALPSLSPDAKLAVQVPFGFEVELAEGEKFAIVRFRIPGNIQANRFVKFQQAPSGDPQLTFFDFDQFAGEGATFSVDEAGNTVVTLFVEDNGAFDFNPEPGVVLDPGLPVRQQVLEFISDGSTDLNLVLRKFGDDLQILNKATNSVVASRTLADTRAIFVTGTDERNDTLTIDFSTGIFELPDFLRFDGGDGTGLDNLRVIGGKFDSSTYTAIGTHNGEIQLDGLQVLFTGVETAREETTVDNRAFQIANDLGQSSTTDLTIRIADVGSSSDKLMTIDDGGAGLFRGLTFTLPVNRLEVISAGANDTILFVSSDQQAQGHLIIDGRAGDDVIDAGGLTGNAFSRVTLIGGMGNDQLFGSAQKDILFGGTGNDDLTGRQGNDILNGNDGDDTFRINSGDGVDDINTGLGNDVVLRDGIPSSLTGDDILFFDESSRTFQLGTNIGNQFSWAQSGRLPANIDTFIGDFDGDGDLDAAFLNLSTRNINLLTNNAGSFSLPQLRGKMASAGVADHFHVLDMDGDGIEEILYQYVIDDVIESPVNFNVTGQLWTKSLLPGGIQDFKIRAQVGFASFAVGDFNGDLRDDLVGLIPGTDALANPVTNLIPFISVNAGGNLTAVLGAGRFSAIDLRSPMTADLNGDGRDDLIVQSTTGQILHATTTGNLRGILTGVHNFVSSSRAPNLNPNSYIPGFLLGTINDDRFADLVAIESNQANFFVGRTSLNGSFLNPSIIGLLALTGQGDPTHEFKMGDFNSDGFDDLVGLGDIVEVFLSNPSTNLFGPGLNFGPGPASS
ncbi:MAG: VCBS repeat-containing protein [Planctomycetaceae bacterium]|nr:VCBS repeat-containing protein [Planctomycetaceae bacterium]